MTQKSRSFQSAPTIRGHESPIVFISWKYWDEIAKEEWMDQVRITIATIFSEQVMGIISLILLCVLIIPLVFPPMALLQGVSTIIDVGIWIFFILEYSCKLLVDKDRKSFFFKPWHLVDLVIITAPFFSLLAGTGYVLTQYLRILRGMQALQVLIRGGLSARDLLFSPETEFLSGDQEAMEVSFLPLSGGNSGADQKPRNFQKSVVVAGRDNTYPDGCWIDIVSWSGKDIPLLSEITHLPEYILETKLHDNAYPRAEEHDDSISFFLKLPVIITDSQDKRRWNITWHGLLIILSGSSIISIAQRRSYNRDQIAEKIQIPEERGVGLQVFRLILHDTLTIIGDMIGGADEQLIFLETEQTNRIPANFLKMIYQIRKELGYIISWLLHTREGLDLITTAKDDEINGEIRHLASLVDRCNMLANNAAATQTSFSELSDYYLDSNGYQMNRVMKFLAVLTALTMPPALIGGLLGMNLIDQPWSATLPQIITAISMVMLLTTWVYFNLGWFTR